jgi:hypothetical protein
MSVEIGAEAALFPINGIAVAVHGARDITQLNHMPSIAREGREGRVILIGLDRKDTLYRLALQ